MDYGCDVPSSEDEEVSPLIIAKRNDNNSFRVYPSRWYILFVFSLISLEESVIWNTFSPVASDVKRIYNVGDDSLTILVAYGPIVFIPMLPVAILIFYRFGLRRCIVFTAFLEFVICIIRPFATSDSFFAIHIAQAINGFCGCFVQALPPAISAAWFPPNQRATATAIASLANVAGVAVSFLMAPFFVSQWSLSVYLYFQAAGALLLLIMVVVYFPNSPPIPPSISADRKKETFLEGLRLLSRNPNFLLLATCGGVSAGALSGWGSVLSLILAAPPYNFHETIVVGTFDDFLLSSGWLGFVTTTVGFLAGVLAGMVVDRVHHYKRTIVLLYASGGTGFLFFALLITGTLPASPVAVWALVLLGEVCVNTALPIVYESGSEAAYPVSEGSVGGMISEMQNLGCLVFQIFAFAGLLQAHPTAMNWVLTGAIFACSLAMMFYTDSYKRLHVDLTFDHDAAHVQNE